MLTFISRSERPKSNIEETRERKAEVLDWARDNLTARNLEIVTRVLNGESCGAVSRSFGISTGRAWQIVTNASNRALRPVDTDSYMNSQQSAALKQMGFSTRAANILAHARAWDIEAVKKLTEDQLLALPNCSKKTVQHILEVRDSQ